MDLPIGQEISRKEFWRAHIESAEGFNGTNKEYCLQHGLNPSSFSAHRKKLGYSRSKKAASQKAPAFSQVRMTQPIAIEPSSPKLPDAKWLAEFLKAWGSLS